MREPLLPDELVNEQWSEGNPSDNPDWHARALRALASQLGVGNDFYFPLLGAASKLEMYQRGETYAAATKKEG
jgi:hypothetical protein